MCDYSLMCLPNRLAVEGEQLVVHRFLTGVIGLASPSDLQKRAASQQVQPTGLWSALRSYYRPSEARLVPAVCVPPGAQLTLRDIPKRLQKELGVGPVEEVAFAQLSASAYQYRDGLRFKNGAHILLQQLEEGQRIDVLCLSPVATVEQGELALHK